MDSISFIFGISIGCTVYLIDPLSSFISILSNSLISTFDIDAFNLISGRFLIDSCNVDISTSLIFEMIFKLGIFIFDISFEKLFNSPRSDPNSLDNDVTDLPISVILSCILSE